jgi:anti-anti-sigma factor
MEIRKDGAVVIVSLNEEDLNDPKNTAGVVENLLTMDGENKIIIDLSAVENIYSMQIGTLVTIHVLCYENVAVMKLAGAKKKVREILKMVGLETMMEMHHGADVAMQSFASQSTAPAVRDNPLPVLENLPKDPRVKH